MALPASIRVNVSAPFPTLVQGSGPITLTKTNGVWTFGLSFAVFPTTNPPVDPTAYQALVYNPSTGIYSVLTLAAIFSSITTGGARTITAAGAVTVTASDTFIRMAKTVSATTAINLPSAVSRNGLDLTVKDAKGDWTAFNIAINALAGEDIDGITAAAGGYPGTMNFQAITLRPRANGYDVIHSG